MRNMRFAVLVAATAASAACAIAQPRGAGRLDQKQVDVPKENVVVERGERKLERAHLLKYLRDQLNLSNEQKSQWDNVVLGYYRIEVDRLKQEAKDKLPEIGRLNQEIAAAARDGNSELANELRDKLEDLLPINRVVDESIARGREMLSRPQSRRLDRILEAVRRGKPVDLRLKPREAVRAAESLNLSDEQRATLVKLQDGLRLKMGAVKLNNDEARQQVMEDFMEGIRSALSPAQIEAFDQLIMDRAKAFQDTDDALSPAKAEEHAPEQDVEAPNGHLPEP